MLNYQNMNAKNREISLCYAFARYGRRCYHCNTTLQDLITEAEIKEMITETPRKLPVILVENLPNNGFHNDPTDPSLVPSCWSCNRNKNKYDTSQATERQLTREKLDSIKFREPYHTNLINYLMDNSHICHYELRCLSEQLSNGANETTCLRYYRQRKHTRANQKGIYKEFSYDCGTSDCNGVHVCLKGEVPLDLFKDESHTLQKDYNSQYMDGDRDKYEHHIRPTTPFITFREFYTTHTKLVQQFQNVNLDDFL